MLFASVLHEDRSVLDLLRADYTFLNERLAEHYGIAGSLRQQLPAGARDAGRAQRPSGPRQYPHCHLACRPHFAGGARQVDSRESARRASAAAAASKCRRWRITPKERRRNPCGRGWSCIARNADLRQLPQDDGPHRLFARKLRRRGCLADRRVGLRRSMRAASWPTARK